ncbi:unnamed protein product [Linum tenue]|uniref:Uncharacterized protein n=1 Tax=Linum tenue TaxID=586396 RepID=A0AAV0JXI1_9ROSI|nr:unnamed protein product [Linum tenue]
MQIRLQGMVLTHLRPLLLPPFRFSPPPDPVRRRRQTASSDSLLRSRTHLELSPLAQSTKPVRCRDCGLL